VLLLGGFCHNRVVQASSSFAPLFGFTPTPTVVHTPTPYPTATPVREIGGVDLAISKTGDPSKVLPGEDVTFTIMVANHGQHTAVDVVITDQVPQYLDILEVTTSQGTVAIEGQEVTVEVGDVGAGFAVEIVICTRVQPNVSAPITLENVALLDSPNGGSRTSPPAMVTISDPLPPLMPDTGRVSFSWMAAMILGTAFSILGFWMERRRLKGSGS
jgi:uncharacterized repeat protein (TIGR01451 family)